MTGFSQTRRSVMAAAGSALMAPVLMPMASAAPASAPAVDKAQINQFRLGEFTVTVICDGMRVADKPQETFGTNQAPGAVAQLLHENFLPQDKYVNMFSPVLIDTGAELILFDTGMGEGGRANGMGKLREGIAAAGYSPDQVSLVVLTHLHGDHIGGLLEGGKPAFPKARYLTGRVEYDFWTDAARMGSPAESGHKAVLTNVVPLADRMSFLTGGDAIASGITALEAFGHTPGHLVFRVESAGKALMLTADTANHFVLSLQRPDWEVRFDMDKARAAQTRQHIFGMIAHERLPFIGYHMPFPCVGFVEKTAEGFRFVAASYQFRV
jgi:glyoxylase-like metal-dependent hydrolase (beta-lactamase superfamily II)